MKDKPMDEELVQNIDNLIPKILDDVIRNNRELVELGLSTVDDIRALHSEIQPGLPVKDTINDWRFISLRDKQSGFAQVLLLGRSQNENVAWLTSSIVQIDLTRNCVMTKSESYYGLGSQGIGEPPREQLIHVCATLHRWGSGTLLGVTHFFY